MQIQETYHLAENNPLPNTNLTELSQDEMSSVEGGSIWYEIGYAAGTVCRYIDGALTNMGKTH